MSDRANPFLSWVWTASSQWGGAEIWSKFASILTGTRDPAAPETPAAADAPPGPPLAQPASPPTPPEFAPIIAGDPTSFTTHVLDDNANDTVFGPGNDVIYALDGDDTIWAGTGQDLIDGGDGADLIVAVDGDDVVLGGAGDDTVTGGDGQDSLHGGDGDDSLSGGDGDDLLVGDAGNDTLEGGAGVNTLTGGTGADIFRISTTEGTTVTDFTAGTDAAADRVDVAALVGTAYLGGGLPEDLVRLHRLPDGRTILQVDRDGTGAGFGWEDAVDLGQRTAHEVIGLILTPNGTAPDHTLTVSPYAPHPSGTWTVTHPPAAVIEGRDGTVTLTVARTDTTLTTTVYLTTAAAAPGGNAGDYVDLSAVAVAFAVGQASATVDLTILNDTTGEASEAVQLGLHSTAAGLPTELLAEDTVTILDDDAVTPPATDGNDEIALSLSPLDPGHRLFNAGDGTDIITLDMAGFATDVTLSATPGEFAITTGPGGGAPPETTQILMSTEALILTSGAGSDALDLSGNPGVHQVFAGEGGDTVTGSTGGERIDAGGGADSVDAGAGVDVIYGGLGDDTLAGGDDTDALFGGADDDEIEGGAGDDGLDGGTGADLLQGGAGIDWLYGGDGADTLIGGTETDALFGDGEDDLLQGGAGDDGLDGGWGNDTLEGGSGVDWLYGSFGNDLLHGAELTADSADTDALFGQDGNDTLYGGGGGDALDGGAGNDLLDGGDGVDWLFGQGSADTLRGGADGDVLFGGSGADLLEGGTGHDALDGGSGADRLSGGAGTDILFGGSGSDEFLFVSPDDGEDLVRDFTPGVDQILIDAAGFGLTGAPGALPPSQWVEGVALPGDFGQAGPVFFFSTHWNALFFDPDGGVSGNATAIAGFETGLPGVDDIWLI